MTDRLRRDARPTTTLGDALRAAAELAGTVGAASRLELLDLAASADRMLDTADDNPKPPRPNGRAAGGTSAAFTIRTDTAYILRDGAGRELAILELHDHGPRGPVLVRLETLNWRDRIDPMHRPGRPDGGAVTLRLASRAPR